MINRQERDQRKRDQGAGTLQSLESVNIDLYNSYSANLLVEAIPSRKINIEDAVNVWLYEHKVISKFLELIAIFACTAGPFIFWALEIK